MEDAAGWQVIIKVPRPNGGEDEHLWVLAISDKDQVREKLWLTRIPCEAQFEPLSIEQLGELELEPGEVRRVWLPRTASPRVGPVPDDVGEPEQQRDVAPPTSPEGPEIGSKSEEADNDQSRDWLENHPTHGVLEAPSQRSRSDERLWRRLWTPRHRSEDG